MNGTRYGGIRYAIPIGILRVNGLSMGLSGFGASH